MISHSLFRPVLAALAVIVPAALLAPAALANPVSLAPLHAGNFGAGTGADATFVQIDPNWQGSTVLWNEATRTYGNGQAIGSYGWGTGIWGRADWDRVQATAAGQGGAGAPGILERWDGKVSTINYGNRCYNAEYEAAWGMAQHLPVADGGACGSDGGNWTAHFNGFIRITEAGLYNFSVLYDDGFFFRLVGADGSSLEISQDYLNPRDREGFVDDLQLGIGLYAFELGSWNRLEAGVVDLRWSRGDETWTLVPTENLLPDSAVDEPATLALGLLALGAALAARRRRAGLRQ